MFNCIIDKTQTEKPGYQPPISGAVLHLIGSCHATLKQTAVENKEEEVIINKARLLFRANISNPTRLSRPHRSSMWGTHGSVNYLKTKAAYHQDNIICNLRLVQAMLKSVEYG